MRVVCLFERLTVINKVLWMDESQRRMVWYQCHAEDEYGACASEALFVNLLSRDAPTDISSEDLATLVVPLLRIAGVEPDDLVPDLHEGRSL